MLTTIMIAGKFDPLHEGHILHIREAAGLVKSSGSSGFLCVVTHTDEVIRKVKNGRCNVPLWARKEIINGILLMEGIQGTTYVAEDYDDTDGTVTATLKALHPQIFAKGGDRTPLTMPKEEVEICTRLGIKLVYGIGAALNSSSSMPIQKIPGGDT